MGIGIVKNIKYLLDCVLTVIYDDYGNCIICKDIEEESYLCARCTAKIANNEIHHYIKDGNNTVECYSAGYYSGIIKELVLSLKYKKDFRCGKVIADIIYNIIIKNNLQFDFITFVPSGKRALKRRGYNQAEYISRLVAQKCSKKLIPCLVKFRETKDQIGLGRNDRWANLSGSFRYEYKKDITNSQVLLIDDVITTGATAFYCSELLLNNGCGKVIILTAAKSSI
jgi:competence protein ComFC